MTSDPAIDPAAFRAALGRFATGICVVTTAAEDGGEGAAITVNSFTSLSLDPPLVLFCIDRGASSLAAFQRCASFAVNVLAEDQEALSRRFAACPAPPFAGLDCERLVTGAPILPGTLAAIDCRREAVHAGGDHLIIVGRVAGLRHREGRPLLYFAGRYAALA
ncbi:MAG: hypothetical protein OHK0024_26130 [Thalassobaculales bacterium]